MRTLIYKRTHSGDPDPVSGVFGNNNCMKTVRAWGFDAVIGIGGVGKEPVSKGIAGKLTWIGIGKHETHTDRRRPFVSPETPLVTFDHFLYYGEEGPSLDEIAPALARRMFDRNVRILMDSLTPQQEKEVEKILALARRAPPSDQLVDGGLIGSAGKCSTKSPKRRASVDCRPTKRKRAKVACDRKL